MALYTQAQTTVKIFVGDLTATETSASAGSLAKEVNDYILTLDSTNEANISINTSPLGYGNKVAITVVGTV
jgi:hypothetical protein